MAYIILETGQNGCHLLSVPERIGSGLEISYVAQDTSDPPCSLWSTTGPSAKTSPPRSFHCNEAFL